MNLINEIINGYKVTEFIDSGGFGSVYKAEREKEIFALKIFREDYVLREYRAKGKKNRINREIEIMKSISHPNLIKYIDDFKIDIGGVPSYFLVMEYIEGITLRKVIEDKDLSSNKLIKIFEGILDGIHALHTVRGNEDDKGIIHRDLKPENIMVNGKGVKILDYGISKVIDYTTITNTGEVMGSPVYMSPEQINDSKNIDKRSDLYSLGVILYEMLTKKLPYEFTTLPELYDRIINSAPIPPRRWDLMIDNQVENVILRLLEKYPYQRFPSVMDLKNTLNNRRLPKSNISYDTSIRFFIRLWNEKSAIQDFTKRYTDQVNVIFPVNYQNQQKNLLSTIQKGNFKKIFDPATVRLAYSSQQSVKGLQELPYAPEKFEIITPSYLDDNSKKRNYVKQVIDEQSKLKPNILLTPFHYVHNTNVSPTQRRNPVADWFDLDIKLIKESVDYKKSIPEYRELPLYAGICINSNSLLDQSYRIDFLNIFSSLGCDGYLIYVDNINQEVNMPTLFHYIKTLTTLQTSTGKPVIAGRVSPMVGLGLICAGISGFSSGTSRFETFYEDLYKEESDAYNMYERYYFQELLGTIAIQRRNPVKLNTIFENLGICDCYYCKGKNYVDIIKAPNNKLHFLEQIHKEIREIKNTSPQDRISYFLKRLNTANTNYQKLSDVFKPADYSYINNWEEVFSELNS